MSSFVRRSIISLCKMPSNQQSRKRKQMPRLALGTRKLATVAVILLAITTVCVGGENTNDSTPSPSPRVSVSATATASESPSLSATASESPSASASGSLSATVSPSRSVSPSATSSTSKTATPSASVSPSATPSSSRSASPSFSPTASPTVSRTPSETPSKTGTASITATISPTSSQSPTVSRTPSETPSITGTASITATVTPTSSVTASVTPSPSITPSVTQTLPPSPSQTSTPSNTPTSSPSSTSTRTPSNTPSSSITASPSMTSEAVAPSPERASVRRSRIREANICDVDEEGDKAAISRFRDWPGITNGVVLEGYPNSEQGRGALRITPRDSTEDCQDAQVRILCPDCPNGLVIGNGVELTRSDREDRVLVFATASGENGKLIARAIDPSSTGSVIEAEPVSMSRECSVSESIEVFFPVQGSFRPLLMASMDCGNGERAAILYSSDSTWIESESSPSAFILDRESAFTSPVLSSSPDRKFVLAFSGGDPSGGQSPAMICAFDSSIKCTNFRLRFEPLASIDGAKWVSATTLIIYGKAERPTGQNIATVSLLENVPTAESGEINFEGVSSKATGLRIRLREGGSSLRNLNLKGLTVDESSDNNRLLRRGLSSRSNFDLAINAETDFHVRTLQHSIEGLATGEDADESDVDIPTGEEEGSSSISTGAMAGIVVVVLALAMFSAFYVWRYGKGPLFRRKQSKPKLTTRPTLQPFMSAGGSPRRSPARFRDESRRMPRRFSSNSTGKRPWLKRFSSSSTEVTQKNLYHNRGRDRVIKRYPSVSSEASQRDSPPRRHPRPNLSRLRSFGSRSSQSQASTRGAVSNVPRLSRGFKKGISRRPSSASERTQDRINPLREHRSARRVPPRPSTTAPSGRR